MKIKISKSDFLDALSKVRWTVSTSKSIELLRCFVFKDNKVATYNGQASTVTAFALEGADFAIEATKFYKIVSALFSEIEVELKGNSLILKSGGNKTTLGTMPTQGFPDVIPPNAQSFCTAQDFVSSLERIAFTIGTNAMKPNLLGVGIRGNYLYSSDGKRISRAALASPASAALSIPPQAVENLCKLGQPSYMFSAGADVGAFYDSTKTIYVSRTLADPFPYDAVDKMFAEPSSEGCIVEFPQELPAAISRVEALAASDDTRLKVENTGEELVLSAESPTGSARESLEWKCPLKFSFFIRPAFFKTGFERSRTIDISDVVSGSNRRLRFSDVGFDHFCALVSE